MGTRMRVWLNTVETIASFFEASFSATPVYPLVDRTFFDGNGPDFDALMAWFKQRANWGLQNDGLTSSETLDAEWSGLPLALEQLNSTQTSGDCLCADIANGSTTSMATISCSTRSTSTTPPMSGT